MSSWDVCACLGGQHRRRYAAAAERRSLLVPACWAGVASSAAAAQPEKFGWPGRWPSFRRGCVYRCIRGCLKLQRPQRCSDNNMASASVATGERSDGAVARWAETLHRTLTDGCGVPRRRSSAPASAPLPPPGSTLQRSQPRHTTSRRRVRQGLRRQGHLHVKQEGAPHEPQGAAALLVLLCTQIRRCPPPHPLEACS